MVEAVAALFEPQASRRRIRYVVEDHPRSVTSDPGEARRPGSSPYAESGSAVDRSAATSGSSRAVGLDGIRGLAALYVVVHHCWLITFHGYPANTGPAWLGWLVYGHLAVVVFIVLTGFSLAIAPARRGWQLGGTLRFAQRRAWRILPPYWAALIFSLIIAWTVTPQLHSGPPTGRSVLVYGLLLQDVTTAPIPNGAFWSIAVEAELYLIFPLLVLMRRRLSTATVLAAVTVPVVAMGLLSPGMATADKLTGVTPQFAPLFAVGVLAAGIVAARDRIRRMPWPWLAALAAAPVIVLLLAGVATNQPGALVRLLTTRPLRRLGSYSYSLYLLHVPIVLGISRTIAAHYAAPGLPAFWVTLGLGVPISLLTARWFAAIFEIPFQRYCSWAALRGAAQARRGVGQRPTAGPAVSQRRPVEVTPG